jgi:hypothetical protein
MLLRRCGLPHHSTSRRPTGDTPTLLALINLQLPMFGNFCCLLDSRSLVGLRALAPSGQTTRLLNIKRGDHNEYDDAEGWVHSCSPRGLSQPHPACSGMQMYGYACARKPSEPKEF